MGEKIIVGPINKGLRTDRKPFNIDNDSFPVLINAYQWRGRIKRKRGTSLLCRLQRRLGVTDGAGNLVVTILPSSVLNPITTGIATFVVGVNIFVDPGTTPNPGTQTLLTNGPGTATLNRETGVLTITGTGALAATAVFYYPTLPVMGLEDLILTTNQFPRTMAFDTRYSYGILSTAPYTSYDVSFYKNPGTSGTYTEKTVWTPTTWNGQDYQQFFTVNYQGALWATNGITQPFITTNIGMQFAPATSITYVANTATTLTVQILNGPLVVGDFVFANEWTTNKGLNYQTGYVTTVTPNTPGPGTQQVVITFPSATIGAGPLTPGILQYLTNRSDVTKDCIRWFDGDPVDTNGNFLTGKGWVNFMPPLSQGIFSIADLPAAIYYLVGAKMIIPFKDRLLFLGPVVQTSSGVPKYLQDTVIYSLNGTPYYTASYTNSPSAAVDTPTNPPLTPGFVPLLVPDNQTSFPPGYFEDQAGFGGFLQAGIDEPINTCETSGDVLIVGFSFSQTKLVYTGNDIIPFLFYLINTELGSSSTFGSVNMGSGVLSRGSRGYVSTDQTQAERFDLQIPDEVFQVRLINNGAERFTCQRDYINEWIYFTYPSTAYKFPSQTLQYNYRENTFAQFNECFTTYGIFRKVTGYTWATIGLIYSTWKKWNDPWNAGSATLLQPEIIGGNQQGFVLIRAEGTSEGNSLAIQNIVGNTVTSPNHTLNQDDYIVISGATGTVASAVNNKIFSVTATTDNTFNLLPPLLPGFTYTGGAVITRMYVPFVQSRQFPTSWAMGRKTRLGPQQYLLGATANSEITLLIYLSQNASSPYNSGPIIPALNSPNNSLIYSTVLYTCTESSNLGLTPANTNLQMISNIDSAGVDASSPQDSIWHRVNTSLIGDTIQVGFTMSDAQMREPTFKNQFSEIELHGFLLDVSPSQWLA